MTLSFFLWFIISSILLGFWFWTSYLVFRQKSAWKTFADKRDLRYYSQGFYKSPSMNGAIDGYNISFFNSEHSELDARSQRQLTAIEINLHSGLSVPSAIASGGMSVVVDTLDLHKEYKPYNKDGNRKDWDNSYVIRTQNTSYMHEYMNDKRVDGIIDLMKLNKMWVIILFVEETGLLRVDTPLPLDNPHKVNEIVKKLIEVARTLELGEGEEKDIIRNMPKVDPKKQRTLDIDDDLLDDDIGLELED